ncbi:MAG: hypothetical protein EOP21_06670, partial [Hyphomicrobiales bacterium]
GQPFNNMLSELAPTGQKDEKNAAVVLGITGTGGAGKSSVTDEIVRRFLNTYTDKTIAVISVDPSKKKTGGALLGDRIRMNAISSPRAYMRSLATRESDVALSQYVQQAIDICRAAAFDFIILESAGVGQSDASILDYCNLSMYVMTPEYGAPSQLEKINMLDYADVDSLIGGIADQDYRDRKVTRFSGRGEYAFTPDTAVFAQLSHSKIKYDNFTLPLDNRSADENMALAGISLDLSGVLRGTAGVGYVERKFDLAAYGKSSGLVADVKVEWFVTELTTVTATAHRFLRDSAVINSPGYFDNQIGMRVDHELLRNLILFAQAEYRHDTYQRIDRTENIVFGGGGARYLLSPQWELGGRVEYTDRTSKGIDRGRNINELRALASVTWKR